MLNNSFSRLWRVIPNVPIDLEHRIAWVIAKQERNGYTFDMEKAIKLYAELSGLTDSREKPLGKSLKPAKRMTLREVEGRTL